MRSVFASGCPLEDSGGAPVLPVENTIALKFAKHLSSQTQSHKNFTVLDSLKLALNGGREFVVSRCSHNAFKERRALLNAIIEKNMHYK